MRAGRQAQIGVILPQVQPMLGTAGHHAVGLVRALGGQIVYHHADIRLIAGQQQWLALQHIMGGVDACQNALRGGFLIARGAVDLPGQVQPRHLQRAQRGG